MRYLRAHPQVSVTKSGRQVRMGLLGEFLRCQSLCGVHILAFSPGRMETLKRAPVWFDKAGDVRNKFLDSSLSG